MISSASGRAALGFLAALLVAPLAAPFDPARQFDPAAGRLLPPGSIRLALRLTGGRTLLAERLEWREAVVVAWHSGHRREIARRGVVTPPGGERPVRFVLGTDRLGRDCLSRLLSGARVSLVLGLVCALLAGALGLAIGLSAALSSPLADAAIMRSTDALLAFPKISIVLLAVALVEPDTVTLVAILALTGWMATARLIRAEARALLEAPFVAAAVATGVSRPRIARRHLLPHLAPLVAIAVALQTADVVLLEAGLSFLGFGASSAAPSWGRLIAEGASELPNSWWVSTFPSACLAALVIALNDLAEGLRRHLDVTGAGSRARC